MRHVFVLNPAAGKKHAALEEEIRCACAHMQEDYTIYVTKAPLDATEYVRAQAASGELLRFYACGGDGTLTEVATGARGFANAEVACIPCGSANDYVRAYGRTAAFLDIAAQLRGTAVPVDAIDCNGRLSINICAMGMDAAVAYKMARYKNWPLVTGPMAYELAIVDCFVHRIGCDLTVTMTDETGTDHVETGRFFFSLAASGQYYGGGYRGAPLAVPDDGMLDFVLIRAMPRRKIPGFLKKYKAGEHETMAVCTMARGKQMHITAAAPTVVTVDGECFMASEITFSLLPGALRFVLPETVTADWQHERQKIVKKL